MLGIVTLMVVTMVMASLVGEIDPLLFRHQFHQCRQELFIE